MRVQPLYLWATAVTSATGSVLDTVQLDIRPVVKGVEVIALVIFCDGLTFRVSPQINY